MQGEKLSGNGGGWLRNSPRLATLIGNYLQAPVAQLDRASGYEPEGRMFESCRAHHNKSPKTIITGTSGPFAFRMFSAPVCRLESSLHEEVLCQTNQEHSTIGKMLQVSHGVNAGCLMKITRRNLPRMLPWPRPRQERSAQAQDSTGPLERDSHTSASRHVERPLSWLLREHGYPDAERGRAGAQVGCI